MRAYSEKRYADAVEAVRGGLEHMPGHADLDYNYACFATLRALPATRRLRTSDGPFSCALGSARTRAETTTRRGLRYDPRFEDALQGEPGLRRASLLGRRSRTLAQPMLATVEDLGLL